MSDSDLPSPPRVAGLELEANSIVTGVGSLREPPSYVPGTEPPPRSWCCRWCDAPLSRVLLDLGKSPLANSFVPWERRDEPELILPLRTYVCESCLLVQVPAFARAESIFSDYLYFSSYSRTWLEHNRQLAEALIERLDLHGGSKVVEVASNDGYLLRNFVAAGIPCLGIEPAHNVAQVALDAGIPTRVGFFGQEVAENLVEEGWRADLVLAINVLAHVPDLRSFVGGLATLLGPEGVLHLEFPSLLSLLRDGLFDTIYHEHYSYYSLLVVDRILAEVGLRVFDVQERTTHGGSLRVLACPESCDRFPRSSTVETVLEAERAHRLDSVEGYDGLQARADTTKAALLEFLSGAHARGETVAGYGAPAKGNTLLNFCGVGRDLLAYTVDLSPHKQQRWLPGTGIPVRHPDALLDDPPDYVLILPWNLRDEIAAQLAPLRALGTRLVVALPEFEVLP